MIITGKLYRMIGELFNSAQSSVVIASYALDTGEKAKGLFKGLAQKMDADPSLKVTMFANVGRPYGSPKADSDLIAEFVDTFSNDIWPGERLPVVYYDPRALSEKHGPKSCLHAKCVVVDDMRAFVTSANFTEAAHERNIEAGILIENPIVAASLREQFESLVEKNLLQRLPTPTHRSS